MRELRKTIAACYVGNFRCSVDGLLILMKLKAPARISTAGLTSLQGLFLGLWGIHHALGVLGGVDA